MIAVSGLVKRYGTFTAVDGVSLEVRPGQIHGFLGPNGAGKTTTIRMIAGLLKPTAGRILVNGHDLAVSPEAAKASLGFIPDRPFIYEKLTAGEFLTLPCRPVRDRRWQASTTASARCSTCSSWDDGEMSSSRAFRTA